MDDNNKSWIAPINDSPEEIQRLEKWLDSHQEFVESYLEKKNNRWLLETYRSSKVSSRPESGANTPVRKISAQEFSSVPLQPMMNTNEDGSTSFLTQDDSTRSKSPLMSADDLGGLNECQVMTELVKDIANELNLRILCTKILQNLCVLTKADRGSLFLVERDKQKDSAFLRNTVFDVNALSLSCTDAKVCDLLKEVQFGEGIVGVVAKTGEMINTPDAYQDPRFNRKVDQSTGYKTKSILCLPIKNVRGEVIGVAQGINKNGDKNPQPFTENDATIFRTYLSFCGIGITNAQIYNISKLESKRNQVMLELAKMVFEEQSTLSKLVGRILRNMQSLFECERLTLIASLLACPSDDDPQVYRFEQFLENGIVYHYSQDKNGVYDLTQGISDLPIYKDIISECLKSGEIININECSSLNTFSEDDDFESKAVMCLPVKNNLGVNIAVAQLVSNTRTFQQSDVVILEAFGIFCGLGLQNTSLYERSQLIQAQQRVALEMVSYHTSVTDCEVANLLSQQSPSVDLIDLSFNYLVPNDDQTLLSTVHMFESLDLLNHFQINHSVFIKWLLVIKKNYRHVTYHNWRHAFGVTQLMFSIVQTVDLRSKLGEARCFALLIACLAHDLDHRGTTNTFQKLSESPLAKLYGTSTLEHHHYERFLSITEQQENRIFNGMSRELYDKIISLIRHCILSTDLSVYFQKRNAFFSVVDSFDMNNSDHLQLLFSMLMTASDIGAIAKPWEVEYKVADLIATEYFEQGDRERQDYNLEPCRMMDRRKQSELPIMQVEFIDNICYPVYHALSNLFPRLKPLLDNLMNNRFHWQELADQGASS